MEEIIAIAPTGALGYKPFGELSFAEALKRNPHFIAADAGSWDSGPYYAGAELPHSPREWSKHDILFMLTAALERKIPLIIGGAGGNGTRRQLQWTVELVREIASEKTLRFKAAVIDAQLEKEYLKRKLREKEIVGLGMDRNLTVEDVEQSMLITAQMGVEPIIKAIEAGVDVVIAGRACDDVLFAAIPIMKGFDPGLALHMGKLLECAALSAVPESVSDSMVGYLRKDHFLIEPADPKRRCTTLSVAAHSLYERSHPFIQPGPGGVNDLTGCKYEQYDQRKVKVTGSKFIKDEIYKVKLEGVAWIGYRTVGIVGIRDPIMIANIDDIMTGVRKEVEAAFPGYGKDYRVAHHLYGKNAVMGELEPNKDAIPHELGLVTEAVGKSQNLASQICRYVEHTLLFYPFKGIKTTAGNIAHINSVETMDTGPAYELSVDHLLSLNDPCECFPMKIVEI